MEENWAVVMDAVQGHLLPLWSVKNIQAFSNSVLTLKLFDFKV